MNGIPTPQEIADARRDKLKMNTEAVRAGMFAAMIDMATMMQANNVDDGSAAIVDGAMLFAVELFDNAMVKAGHAPSVVRKALLANVNRCLSAARAKRAAELKADKE